MKYTNEQLTAKLDEFITEGYKQFPGGEIDQYRFYIEAPSSEWERLVPGTTSKNDIKRPHFIYRGEIVMRGTAWRVVSYEAS